MIAFDPSFMGESGPENARFVRSPDLNTEDFSSMDFLSAQGFVDSERIGIRGWAINAAAMDTHIKATVSSATHDNSSQRERLNDAADSADVRFETKKPNTPSGPPIIGTAAMNSPAACRIPCPRTRLSS